MCSLVVRTREADGTPSNQMALVIKPQKMAQRWLLQFSPSKAFGQNGQLE
jgi:hypothetical protein